MAKHPKHLSLYQSDDSWSLMVSRPDDVFKHYDYLSRDQIESVLRLMREHYIIDPHLWKSNDSICISAFRKVVKI